MHEKAQIFINTKKGEERVKYQKEKEELQQKKNIKK